MAPNLLLLKDVTPEAKNWTSHVIVAEKSLHKLGKYGKPYQRFILQDLEATKVQATVFGDDIEVLKNKLKLYHTYAITNAGVSAIEAIHKFVDNNYQWQLTGRTPIKEVQIDGLTQRAVDHNLIKLADVDSVVTDTDPKLNILFAILEVGARRKTAKTFVADLHVIDQGLKPTTITLWDQFSDIDAGEMSKLSGSFPIALGTRLKRSPYYATGLSTRSSTIFMLNPPLEEAAELQAWCVKNAASIRALPNYKNSPGSMISTSPPAPNKLLKIANLPPTVDTVQYLAIQGMIRVTDFDQKYYFIACSKCNRASDAYDDDDLQCNYCQETVPPLPTLMIITQITDPTGSITATIFGQDAEQLFETTVAEIKENIVDGHLTLSMMEKMSAPKHRNINIKVSKNEFGSINICKFTVKGVFPATAQDEQLLLGQSSTPPNKVQKQLFKHDASSASQTTNEEKMEISTEHTLKVGHHKKRD